MINRRFTQIVLLAFVLKLALLGFTAWKVPESRVLIDSHDYLLTGRTLVTEGVFSRGYNSEGQRQYEWYRTPGYPFFLGVVHYLLNIPLSGVALIQVFLTLIAAYMVYRAAVTIDSRLGFLSALVILYDPPITIFSMLILTETLFLFFMAAFMYTMVLYLRNPRWKMLAISACILILAAYTRPIGFWIGVVTAAFLLLTAFRKRAKTMAVHAFAFCLIVHAALGVWQMRNYRHFGVWTFSSIDRATLGQKGLVGSYARVKNKTNCVECMPPAAYYLNMASRSLVGLMTRPGTLKYFGSRTLKAVGKVFSYPFVAFWLAGFLYGITKMNDDLTLQFLLLIVLYFAVASVCGAMTGVSARFRVPMMPFIAVLSANGWVTMTECWQKKRKVSRVD